MTRIQLKNKPKDIKDRENRLKQLSKFNKDALTAMTMTELRELASWLIPESRKLKKPELIDKILEITDRFREESRAKIAEIIEYYENATISIAYLKNCFFSGITPHETALMILGIWREKGYKESTLAKTKPQQLRKQLDYISNHIENSSEWCEKLYKMVRETETDLFLGDGKDKSIKTLDGEVNQDYGEEIEHRGEGDNTVILDGEKILNWAKSTIEDAISRENLTNWYLLSFALALTSGRRMVELHGSSLYTDNPLTYELNDDQVYCSQLAKSVEGKDLMFTPLIDAKLWIDGYNKLPENCKQKSHEYVNKVLSRNIAKSRIFVKTLEDLGFTVTDSKRKGSYKDSRDFYVAYCIKHRFADSDFASISAFLKECTGHDSKKSTLSYEKFRIM